MAYYKNANGANLKYISSFLLFLLICFENGGLYSKLHQTQAASTAKRSSKVDPKYEQAVLEALGMKRTPKNTNR